MDGLISDEDWGMGAANSVWENLLEGIISPLHFHYNDELMEITVSFSYWKCLFCRGQQNGQRARRLELDREKPVVGGLKGAH